MIPLTPPVWFFLKLGGAIHCVMVSCFLMLYNIHLSLINNRERLDSLPAAVWFEWNLDWNDGPRCSLAKGVAAFILCRARCLYSEMLSHFSSTSILQHIWPALVPSVCLSMCKIHLHTHSHAHCTCETLGVQQLAQDHFKTWRRSWGLTRLVHNRFTSRSTSTTQWRVHLQHVSVHVYVC